MASLAVHDSRAHGRPLRPPAFFLDHVSGRQEECDPSSCAGLSLKAKRREFNTEPTRLVCLKKKEGEKAETELKLIHI